MTPPMHFNLVRSRLKREDSGTNRPRQLIDLGGGVMTPPYSFVFSLIPMCGADKGE